MNTLTATIRTLELDIKSRTKAIEDSRQAIESLKEKILALKKSASISVHFTPCDKKGDEAERLLTCLENYQTRGYICGLTIEYE